MIVLPPARERDSFRTKRLIEQFSIFCLSKSILAPTLGGEQHAEPHPGMSSIGLVTAYSRQAGAPKDLTRLQVSERCRREGVLKTLNAMSWQQTLHIHSRDRSSDEAEVIR